MSIAVNGVFLEHSTTKLITAINSHITDTKAYTNTLFLKKKKEEEEELY